MYKKIKLFQKRENKVQMGDNKLNSAWALLNYSAHYID